MNIDMRQNLFMSLIIITATTLGSGYAFAQNVDQRIDRMQRDIDTLSRAVYKGEISAQPNPQIVASTPSLEKNYSISIENRLGTMERQIQQLTGQIEELNFRVNKLQTQNANGSLSAQQVPPGLAYNQQQSAAQTAPLTISDKPYSPQNGIESAPLSNAQGNLATGAAPSYAAQPDADSNLTFGKNDAKDYDRAFASLKNGDYPTAQDGFKAFLQTYKDSQLVPNALYWLGETYYVQQQFSEAARIFAQGYQDHPESNKTQDNLLKLGLSLSGMGKKEDACIALLQLAKQGTKETPVVSRAQQEAKKLGCSS
jgi:tol-pal system protein YbgF